MRNQWINHILRLRSEWTFPFVALLLCCCVTGSPRNITVAPLLYSQCNVLVDASSPWRQKLQHIDITRLTYNALRRHGPGPPRYKEGRLYSYQILLVMTCKIAFPSTMYVIGMAVCWINGCTNIWRLPSLHSRGLAHQLRSTGRIDYY